MFLKIYGKKHILFLITFSFCSAEGNAQYYNEFRQFFTSPLYLNPALAGTADGGRLNISGQKFNIKSDGILSPEFYSSSLSFDKYIPDIKGGVGIDILDTRTSNSILSTTSLLFNYSPYISICSESFIIKPAVEVGINYNRIDYQQYFMKDPLSFDSVPPDIHIRKKYYNEINAGIVVFQNKFHAGIALKSINRPVYNGPGFSYIIPVKYTLHAGYHFSKHNGSITASLYPYIIYKQSKQYGFVENFFAAGIAYSKKDSNNLSDNLFQLIHKNSLFGFYLGYQPYRSLTIGELTFQYGVKIKSFQILYSYTLTQSDNFFKDFGLFAHSRSYIIHEISFSYKFLPQKLKMIIIDNLF